MNKPLSVIIMGLGNRGAKYAKLMSTDPAHYQVVGIAEPDPARRDEIRDIFHLNEEVCFADWREILAQPKMADIAVIATMDNEHYEPAMIAIDKGYNLLLEKPVAPTAKECADIANAAREKGVEVLVCHVLRYAPFYVKVKELVREGLLGDIMSVDAVEGVGNIHHSHSYVRGNWHKEAETAPMLLAKSCHDLDIIQWILDKPCKKIQSFGSLTHFVAENAPEGSPKSCVNGDCPVRATCPYDCLRMYVENQKNHRRRIITKGIAKTPVPTDEEVLEALKTTDYGLCVYHANNDVVDHQTVNMEFEGSTTATFSMNAFNRGGRYIRLFGTKGELYANASDTEIKVYLYEGRQKLEFSVPEIEESIVGGHGGGDQGIIQELHQYMSGEYEGFRAANIHVSVRNHLLCFAAEEARHNSTVVDIETYMKKFDLDNHY